MPKPTDSPVKILLADDSVTMHRAVALALKKLPWQLITCDNGQDAFRLTLEQRPDVVIADLDMPGMTGAELCQAIRAKPALARTKLILLCGSFDQVDEARLEQIPADGRLWKPFEAHVLTALVDALLKSAAAAARESSDPTMEVKTQQKPGAADLMRDMTTETFQEMERKVVPLTPVPSVAPPAPPAQEPPQTSSLKETHLPEDLWSTSPSTPAEPKELPPQQRLSPIDIVPPPEQHEPEFDEVNLASFEDLHESRLIDPAVLEDANSLHLEQPAVHPSFATLSAPPAPSAPALSEEALRTIVREEIEKAFGSWLRDRLEKTLSLVIAEIDRT